MQKSKNKELMLLLIVAVIGVVVSIIEKSDNQNAKLGAEQIATVILDNHKISFASGGVIDDNKFKEIQNMNYNELKNYLKADNDFCIYVEDEKGNIILAKGSSKLSRDGIYCRELRKNLNIS